MNMTASSLWNSMVSLNNTTVTENGDKAYKSTLNPLMDFMFKACTMRDSEEKDIVNLFSRALAENDIYAIRLAFYARDIRGGQGERRVFRICMTYLALTKPELFKQVISFIPEYGRWDDLVFLYMTLLKTDLVNDILPIIRDQLTEDIKNCLTNKPVSLLAKWLPSENASSKETIYAAKVLAQALNFSNRDYRKTLSKLRKYLDVTEVKLSSKNVQDINYNTVPSKAMQRYRSAFLRNDNKRYQEYLNALSNPEEHPEVKVNAATLYPFDVIKELNICGYYYDKPTKEAIQLANAQWNALPDFFAGKHDNALVVADVSGSMTGTPMNVCLGLAMYIAERNKGMFKDKFITFSVAPELQDIVGKTIYEKAINLSKAEWDGNTDVDAVFKLIYDAAISNHLSQDELPNTLYIISDMQFDCCNGGEDVSVFEKWTQKFEEAGYKLPLICFWNVSEYGNDNVPITVKDTGAIVCSGYSPSIVKYIMETDITDTMKLVENIVNSPRYKVILGENK